MPRSRAIGGLSMGGLGALNLAFQHPDVFGVVGAHSPSVRLEPDPSAVVPGWRQLLGAQPGLARRSTPAGLDNAQDLARCRDRRRWLPNIEAVHDALVETGPHPEWHEFPGPHEAEYWIEHVPDYLRFYSRALVLPEEAR